MQANDTPVWTFPSAPSTVRGHASHLNATVDGSRILYRSLSNVVIRQADIPYGKVQLFTKHASPVTAIRTGKKGGKVASGDEKGNFKIWCVDDPEFKVEFENTILKDHIRDFAFNDECDRGVAVGEGVLK